MEKFVRNGIVCYSKTGLKHKLTNEQNQDAFQVAKTSDGIQIIALCDGCSSAAFPKLGADVASLQAVNFAKSYPMLQDVFFDEEKATVFANTLLDSIRSCIANLQENFGPAALASTFLFAVFSQGHYLTIQLGDGAIVVSKSGKMQMLPTKQPKTDRQNVTYSTCDLLLRKSFDEIVTVTTGEADHLFLMTDGMRVLYTPVVDSPTFHALSMANAFYSPENRLDMLSKLTEICSSATMDDATLVCVSNTSFSVCDLNVEDRFRLFGFQKPKSKHAKRNIRRAIRFYQALTEQKTVEELAKTLHLSQTAIRRIGNKLEDLGLVKKIGETYRKTNHS